MIIDIFTHFLTARYFREMTEVAPHFGRLRKLAPLHDLDVRLRTMDGFADYRQVLSLPNPPLEAITTPAVGAALARVANDEMADLVERHRDRFPAFVAALPMHDMEAAMAELHRAIRELGARGVQVYTNVAGRPLDDPTFEPLFAAMAEYDLPIWLHPTRTAAVPDYPTENRSRYELWWAFGWPYETSVAMARLVFTGLFARHPGSKIITHHCGGMIPYFEGRVRRSLQLLKTGTVLGGGDGGDPNEDAPAPPPASQLPDLGDFKKFYNDTALFGALGGTRCGLEFFGVDNVTFATDAPFGSIREIAESILQLGLSGEDVKQIYCGNAERLMRMSLS